MGCSFLKASPAPVARLPQVWTLTSLERPIRTVPLTSSLRVVQGMFSPWSRRRQRGLSNHQHETCHLTASIFRKPELKSLTDLRCSHDHCEVITRLNSPLFAAKSCSLKTPTSINDIVMVRALPAQKFDIFMDCPAHLASNSRSHQDMFQLRTSSDSQRPGQEANRTWTEKTMDLTSHQCRGYHERTSYGENKTRL